MFVPEQKNAVRGWLTVMIGGLFVIALAVGVLEDPTETLLYLSRKLAICTMAVVLVTGTVLAIDVFTPHDWLEDIHNDPRACAYIMSAAVIGISLVCCLV